MNHVAVILAGGSGTRFGAERPKQLQLLGGRSVLEYSLDAFEKNVCIKAMVVVSHPAWQQSVVELRDTGRWSKWVAVVAGGETRRASTLAGIRACRTCVRQWSEAECGILFHDAARPLVPQRVITDVCLALERGGKAVSAVLPSTDTMVKLDEQGDMESVQDRAALRRVQTPQGFLLSVIAEAYERAEGDADCHATDDCGMVLRYLPDVRVSSVMGAEENMKLTYPSDLAVLETYLRSQRTTVSEDPLADYQERNLRPLQLRMLEMLDVVAEILDRHGVRWWMDGGTLLGAVRHGGFIPWDDDIDFEVLGADIPKMLDALQRELPSWMVLQPRSGKQPMWKVRCTDSFYVEPGDDFAEPYPKGVFIDLFPMEPAPDFSLRFVRRVARSYARANGILSQPHHYSLRAVAEWFWFGTLRAACRVAWTVGGWFRQRGVCMAQPLECNGLGLIYRKESLFPLQRIPFEGRNLPAPADTDTCLRTIFGDYMKLPPPAARKGHAVFYAPRLSDK